MATPPTEQMKRARKSGHAGAMADTRRSVRVPAIYVWCCHVGAALRAYDINVADGKPSGTNMSPEVVMRWDNEKRKEKKKKR